MSRFRHLSAVATGVLLCANLVGLSLASADPLQLVGEPYRGRQKFVFVGASMTYAEGLANGVHCLRQQNSTVVDSSQIPPRAQLVSATLYISGSLLDDGVDYSGPPHLSIFDNDGFNADDHPQIVTDNARAEADRSVLFTPPGASEPVRVTASPSIVPYVAVYHKVGGTEPGNVGFFMTPIDVKDVIMNEGQGLLAGSYQVADLLADVCYGLEAVCDDEGATPEACPQVHTNGTASFALLLILEDPTLPLSTTTVFQGMQTLLNTSRDFILQDGIAVSDPAQGSLAAYVLEGDLEIGIERPSVAPCLADEYIEVDGDDDPTINGYCLVDEDNPRGNIFNSTINVQTRTTPLPECDPGLPEEQCCQGPGLCPEVGVDIDRFDISPALVPGADRIRVTVGTGGDQIALAMLVVNVGVFEPILHVDSQFRILTAHNDRVRVGDEVILTLAISNTGNVAAENVSVEMSAPSSITNFEVVRIPDGAELETTSTGGQHGTGMLAVSGFRVPPGKIAEVRMHMRTPCASLGANISPKAIISADHIPTFEVQGTATRIGGPGVGECADLSLPDDPSPWGARVLRGGACQSVGVQGSAMLLLYMIGMVLWRARRRRSP